MGGTPKTQPLEMKLSKSQGSLLIECKHPKKKLLADGRQAINRRRGGLMRPKRSHLLSFTEHRGWYDFFDQSKSFNVKNR